MHDQQNKQKIGNRTKAQTLAHLLDLISALSPVTFELFSRPPSSVFPFSIFPCTLVSMQSIKNVRRVTLVKSLQQRETEQKS